MKRSRSSYKPIQSNTMNNKKPDQKYKIFLMFSGLLLCILFAVLFGNVFDLSSKEDKERTVFASVTKENWKAQELSTPKLQLLSNRVSVERLKQVLGQILIPRVPGSTNITIVAANIVSHLQDLGWKLTQDKFVDKPPAPYNQREFRNIIATHNHKSSRRLILACHYDSKVTPEGFLGATDSAVPCSIMIEIAYALNKTLNLLKQQQQSSSKIHDVTLQLLFFDGEEAFVNWSPTDSLYGARHLAEKWRRTNKLKSIDLFILLDLIGTSNTVFRDFHATKTRWFSHAEQTERRMTNAGILKKHDALFKSDRRYNWYQIEDDHIPFLRQGVPVFHMINVPFSRVWHTMEDNYDALDFDRIEIITKIVTNFVAEYLHLSTYI